MTQQTTPDRDVATVRQGELQGAVLEDVKIMLRTVPVMMLRRGGW